MKRFHLGWFNAHGQTPRWNWDDTRQGVGYDWREPELWQDMAKVLERGCFDIVIFADTLYFPDAMGGSQDWAIRHGVYGPTHDPVPLVAMMAAVTKHIGLVPTMSATFYPPFLLARLMASLDHLTRGRIGWNLVTSTGDLAAQNFGLDHIPEHDLRYDMADEFVDLCNQLWASWEPDAVLMDTERRIFADPSKVHPVDFVGKWYRSRGPLTVTSSPQRRPTMVQAGSSPRGRAFGAKHADVVIVGGHSQEEMREYATDMKARAAAEGRNRDDLKVLFCINPVVGETDAIAHHRLEHLKGHASVEEGLGYLAMRTGDLTGRDLDEPFQMRASGPGIYKPPAEKYQTGELTLRQMAVKEAWGDYLPAVGDPATVAEILIDTIGYSGGDGFIIRDSFQPGHVVDFVDLVVPELQRRGAVRTKYSGATLRDHLLEF